MGLIVCAAAVPGCALVGIGCRHFDRMFVDVVAVHMVQMAVVKEIYMVAVADCGMTAIWSVDVGMIAMLRTCTSRHDQSPAVSRCCVDL
jgi:hypothetical protein